MKHWHHENKNCKIWLFGVVRLFVRLPLGLVVFEHYRWGQKGIFEHPHGTHFAHWLLLPHFHFFGNDRLVLPGMVHC
jgi:hypothetical protein